MRRLRPPCDQTGPSGEPPDLQLARKWEYPSCCRAAATFISPL